IASFLYADRMCDLDVIDGQPAILVEYVDRLRYIRATDTDGTSWPSDWNEPPGLVSYAGSLEEINGLPAVLCRNQEFSPTMAAFAISDTPEGIGWSSPTPITETSSTS